MRLQFECWWSKVSIGSIFLSIVFFFIFLSFFLIFLSFCWTPVRSLSTLVTKLAILSQWCFGDLTDEEHVVNSLVKILKPRYQSWSLVKLFQLAFFPHFEHKIWSWFWSWSLAESWRFVNILVLMSGWDFEFAAWFRFCCWILISRFVWELVSWRSYFGKSNQPSGALFLCNVCLREPVKNYLADFFP